MFDTQHSWICPQGTSALWSSRYLLRAIGLWLIACRNINKTGQKKKCWHSTLPLIIGRKNGERGIWTLAPVARPTPLAGAPLRPLEYFSWIRIRLYQYGINANHIGTKRIIHKIFYFVNDFFILFLFLHTLFCYPTRNIFFFLLYARQTVFTYPCNIDADDCL